MEHKEIIELGIKLVIYEAIFEQMNEKTQEELFDSKMELFAKYDKLADVINNQLLPHADGIELSLIDYAKTLLKDIDSTVENLFSVKDASE